MPEEQEIIPSGARAPLLEMRCLGSLDLKLGGMPLLPGAFVRRKALALLKLLVLRAGNPISRDKLIEHLWPGVEEKQGTNRLHVTLHALRTVIEPFHAERRWLFIQNHGDSYAFNQHSPHRIDLYHMRRLATLARQAERVGDWEGALPLLEQAAALYHGDLFEDEPYAAWCELERWDLRNQYLTFIHRLVFLCLRAGVPERVVHWLRQALKFDPLNEELHRSLIEVLIALGWRSMALDQYRTCVRLLSEELGIDPMPETQQLGKKMAVVTGL